MKVVVVLGLVLLMLPMAAAWDNSSMNADYYQLTHGNPLTAWLVTFEHAFGGGVKGQIFYLLLALLPFTLVWIGTQDLFPASMILGLQAWLYRKYLPQVGWPVIVLLIAFGVFAMLIRVFSPKHTD